MEQTQRLNDEKKTKNGYSEKQQQPKYDPLETTHSFARALGLAGIILA